MHEIAEGLNESLKGSVAERLLSSFGRRIYFPKGIVAQTAEAGKRAHKYNATVGMAFEHGEPMLLPSLSEHVSGLTAREAVSYAPTAGVPELREAWAREIRAKNPSLAGASLSTPVVTSGLTNGIAHLGDMFVDEGDTVVLPDLFWGNYRLIFQERDRAQLHTFPFFSGDGLNVDGFAAALRRTAQSTNRIVTILNFPNNPTGYTPTEVEMRGIVDALHARAEDGASILCITDDAYFGLFYDRNSAKESLFAHVAGLHPNILAAKVDGATKEEYAWGLRVGFLTFGSKGMTEEQYAALEEKLKGTIRSSISNSSKISQSLVARVLASPNHESEKELAYERLKRRFDRVRELVEDSSRPQALRPLPFNSGYFMTFACEGIDAEELRQALLDRGIGTIAVGSAYLRVAYATVEEEELTPFFTELYETASSLGN
jgi:aspartate/methionine/tyrosine aminotransferase